MSTTSSRNFTTLYSGAGSVVPQGAYGNANVVSLLNVGTDGGNTVGNITATGAVNTTGTISAAGNITGGNVNTTAVTATTLNGNLAGGTITASTVSASGNITTAGYFIGNFAGNITGNLTVPGANTQVLYNNNGNAGASTGFTFDSAANVFSTPGTITAVGNITAPYFLGNGSQLTGLPATYGNANVVSLLSAFGSNTISTTGNITAGNLITSGAVYASSLTGAAGQDVTITADGTQNINLDADTVRIGDNNVDAVLTTHGAGNLTIKTDNASSANIIVRTGTNANVDLNPHGSGIVNATVLSATGNITASYFLGNGSQLTGLAATYSNANVTALLAAFGSNAISTTGNITAGYFVGDGSLLTNINAGNIIGSYGNANVADFLAAFGSNTVSTTGNVTSGNIASAGVITAGGNVLSGNLILSPGAGAGNINVLTSQAPATVTTTNNPGRIFIGNSYTGNSAGLSVDYDPYSRLRQSRVAVNDKILRVDGNINTSNFTNIYQQELTANMTTPTSSLSRNFAAVNFLHVGGGANAYTASLVNPAAFCGMNGAVAAGTWGNVAVGNITIAAATGMLGAVVPQNGANIGNAFGMVGAMQPGGATANVTNAIGFGTWTIATTGVSPTTVPTNYNAFYNPSNVAVYGALTNINTYRASTNYYAFKNDDDVAQVKLGSLRTYHEYQYATATSGTVNIDKSNAQVQFIAPTANVTIGSYLNFVTTANDSVTNDTQADTVTLIIQQGATPYTVTMPTGNASIKYASNVSTIGNTANSVTMVSITAFRSSANATMYLTTISPEFV